MVKKKVNYGFKMVNHGLKSVNTVKMVNYSKKKKPINYGKNCQLHKKNGQLQKENKRSITVQNCQLWSETVIYSHKQSIMVLNGHLRSKTVNYGQKLSITVKNSKLRGEKTGQLR